MYFYKPTIRRVDMQSVLMSMADEAVGTGKRYETFKEDFKEFLGFKKIEILRSFPSCILQSFMMLSLSENDKIIMSVFESPLVMIVAQEAGLDVVLCDVDIETGRIDKQQCAEKIKNENIKVAYLSSQAGRGEDIEFFKSKGLRIIYDITSLVGMTDPGMGVDVALLSLEEDKIISSAGGGCILTDECEIPQMLYEEKLSDLNIALAQMQFECFDNYLTRRKEIRAIYIQACEISARNNKNRIFSFFDNEKKDNCFTFSLFIENTKDALNFFNKRKIPTIPTFSKTIYEKLKNKTEFKNASFLYNKVYSIPLYYFLKPAEIEEIRKVLSVLP